MKRLGVALGGGALIVCLYGCAQSASIEKRYSQFHELQQTTLTLSSNERFALLGRKHDEWFGEFSDKAALGALSRDEVGLLHRAANDAAFYTGAKKYAELSGLYLSELQARGSVSEDHYRQRYKTLIEVGQFSEADAFAANHPALDLEPLPAFREAQAVRGHRGPTEWVVNGDRGEMIRRPVNLDKPAQIVVVSHPLCHFSQNAVRAIQSDSVLHGAFKDNATWLVPRDPRHFDTLVRWNQAHPEVQMTMTVDRDEWPMLDNWGTPTFYFFKDGRVVEKIVGWPDGGRREAVIEALKQIGLL